MTHETDTAAAPPPAKPGKDGAIPSAKLDEILRLLTESARREEHLLTAVGSQAASLAALQKIVRSALPARLLRLTMEHINTLREKAPTTRLILLAPFKGHTIDLKEGTPIDVTDPRIPLYGRSMQLGLLLSADNDVDALVRQLVDDEVADRARAEAGQEAARKLIEAQAAEGAAAELREQAARLKTGS